MKQPELFVVAAGSGGHILPALILGKQWKEKKTDGKITLFTGSKQLEQTITQTHPEIDRIQTINMPQFSLRNWWNLPVLFFKALFLFFKTLRLMMSYKPESILSTGGILSIPICLAGWLTRTPIHLYELNVIPGKANKLLLPFASKVYITFEQAKQHCRFLWFNFSGKCEQAPYPLRFTEKDTTISKQTVLDAINKKLQDTHNPLLFDTSRKTIFILGGSQGSIFLNKLITNLITQHPELTDTIQIVHQTGKAHADLDSWYIHSNIPALTFSYDNHIQQYYVLADLVISRAGAGSLFELAYFGKKSIIIPLIASTTDHQVHNALAIQQAHPDLFTIITQEKIVTDPEQNFKEILKSLTPST